MKAVNLKFGPVRYVSVAKYARGNARARLLILNEKHRVWLGLPKTLIRAAQFVRSLLPFFYSIGLRDCDSGGRVFAWYVDWGFNTWHADKRLARWHGSGDGEVYRQINFFDF